MRGLNQAYSGGLGSYGLITIITSFLQMHPKIQNERIRQEDNLGVLLIDFFELYSQRFNYDIVGIDIRGDGEYFPKFARDFESNADGFDGKDRLCVQDPADDGRLD
jgi:non-canonical poly(A) RNA polymerase PAPD5/7